MMAKDTVVLAGLRRACVLDWYADGLIEEVPVCHLGGSPIYIYPSSRVDIHLDKKRWHPTTSSAATRNQLGLNTGSGRK